MENQQKELEELKKKLGTLEKKIDELESENQGLLKKLQTRNRLNVIALLVVVGSIGYVLITISTGTDAMVPDLVKDNHLYFWTIVSKNILLTLILMGVLWAGVRLLSEDT
jgi:hypothetical protein